MNDLQTLYNEFTSHYQLSKSKAQRDEALRKLLLLSAPGKGQEQYKYFSSKFFLQPVETQSFKIPKSATALEQTRRVGIAQKHLQNFSGEHFNRIVLYNGELLPELCDLTKCGASVVLEENSAEDKTNQFFPLLNQVFAPKNLRVKIDANKALTKPILVAWIFDDLESNVQYPSLHLQVGSGARAKVAEIFLGGVPDGLMNSRTATTVESNSELEFTQIQALGESSLFHGTTEFICHSHSQLNHVGVSLGAKMSRRDLHFSLPGNGAEVASCSAVQGTGTQRFEEQAFFHHQQGQNISFQLCKSALSDQSVSIVTGRVRIDHGAQKAASEQLVRGLLLSKTAKAYSQPQLEIFADDVKATHGATTGNLSDDEIFYLQSRGIPRPQAEALLKEGFLLEIVVRLSEVHLRESLSQLLRSRSGGAQ